MSLQVWLPLNGDLRNQGLSDLSFSILTSNTVVNNNGKIGKCYENNSYTAGGLVSDKQIYLGQKQSMFCWFKVNTFKSSANLGGTLISQHRYASNCGMGITLRYVSENTGYLSVNTGNGSSRTYHTYYGTTLLEAGKWYHGGYTYDGTTIRLYVNGVLEGAFEYLNMAIVPDYLTVFGWSFTQDGKGMYANHRLDGSINDVRIYNHCLSAKEVKEISKGLVLHMPLAAPGGENMVKNSNFSQNFTSWVNPSNYFNVVEKNGYKCAHVSGTMGTAKSIYQSILSYIDTGNLNQIYTISADICAENIVEGTTNPYINPFYISGTYGDNNAWLGATYLTSTDAENKKLFINNQGKGWVHVNTTFKFNQVPKTMNCRPFARDFTGDIYIKNIKIEKGSIATPWTPNPADPEYTAMGFDDGIEYDVSGYGYNGEKLGTLAWAADSPRYNGCYEFNGVDSVIKCPKDFEVEYSDQLTFSCWGYLDSWNDSTVRHFISSQQTGGIVLGVTSTNVVRARTYRYTAEDYSTAAYWQADYSAANISPGWHMLTGVLGDGFIKLYIDGELKKTTTGNNYGIHFHKTANMYIGAEADSIIFQYPFPCKISDVRIYATAFSDEDVLTLYNTPESLSDSGALFTQGEFTEV